MSKKILTLMGLWAMTTLCLWAQPMSVAEPSYKVVRRIENYPEPRLGDKPDVAEWNAIGNGLHAYWWTALDTHPSLHRVPQAEHTQAQTTQTIRCWRGERVNLQAVLFSNSNQGTLTVRLTPFVYDENENDNDDDNRFATTSNASHATTSNTHSHPHQVSGSFPAGTSSWGEARFLNYVITDDYKTCGNHDFSLRPWLVPDVIDQNKPHPLPAMETRPVWCSIRVPRSAKPGRYTSHLEVLNPQGEVLRTLTIHLHVSSSVLPTPQRQQFHLDLWQQPYAVSRYYGLKPWSKEHIAELRPYIKALAEAGQKVVSTIMFYEPWGVQSHDKFQPMVQSTKHADGTWSYNYDIFDRYVELCAEYGIDKQINCYSMVPWDMTFRYYDEAQGKDVDLKTTTSTPEYRELWTHFLKAFRQHLEQKGWFGKTCIAMDERREPDMLNAYAIAHEQGFKMALAGHYHASLVDKLQDLCLSPSHVRHLTDADRQYRRQHGMATTFYTCCSEPEPNIFSSSTPAEALFLPLHAAANNLDGYLHWSWLNWDDHPLTDSRYFLFGSGDTYNYYPGNRSSVRFESLAAGIQQYEKVQILKEEYREQPEKIAELDRLLEQCRPFHNSPSECAQKVRALIDILNAEE